MKRKIISVMLLLSMMFMFICGCSKTQSFNPGELRYPDKMEICFSEPDERAGEIIEPYSTVIFPYTGKQHKLCVWVYDGDYRFEKTFSLYCKYNQEEMSDKIYFPYTMSSYKKGWPIEVGYYELIVGHTSTDYYMGGFVYITVIIEEI